MGRPGNDLRGWALAMQGRARRALAQLQQGIAALRATGRSIWLPYFCTMLAEVFDLLGHTEDGLQRLAEAHTLMEQNEERWWEAEIYRLRGALLLRHSRHRRRRRKPGFDAPWTSPAASRRNRWSCAPP